MTRHLLRHFEIYLVGFAVVFFLIVILTIDAGASTGLVAALVFVGMATAQGGIQWTDRHRTRLLRARAVVEIREMLRDRVLNGLTTAELWATEDSLSVEQRIAEMRTNLHEIADMVDGLSEAELDTWRLTYAASAHLLEPFADPVLNPGLAPA